MHEDLSFSYLRSAATASFVKRVPQELHTNERILLLQFFSVLKVRKSSNGKNYANIVAKQNSDKNIQPQNDL